MKPRIFLLFLSKRPSRRSSIISSRCISRRCSSRGPAEGRRSHRDKQRIRWPRKHPRNDCCGVVREGANPWDSHLLLIIVPHLGLLLLLLFLSLQQIMLILQELLVQQKLLLQFLRGGKEFLCVGSVPAVFLRLERKQALLFPLALLLHLI